MLIPIEQLQVGMYVVLPGGWLDHPFMRNQFLLDNSKDLARIRDCGFEQIEVDLHRSQVKLSPETEQLADQLEEVSHGDTLVDPKESGQVPEQWNPDNLVPHYLSEALQDRSMTPQQRAEQVYRHSRTMMKRLLESPTAENIQASKAAIYEVSELVLSDDDTALNMLRLTNHDFYTYTHSVNVGVLSLMLAKELYRGSDAHDLQELAAGFFLHDLGKVKVDPAVINKPARLTEAEMRHMRIHPYQGYKLLETAGVLSEECRIIVMQHHECYDGSGYPRALSGEEIHEYGRICGIADVFDALTAERSYKMALSPFEALKLMKERMSHQFDHHLFSSFVQLLRPR